MQRAFLSAALILTALPALAQDEEIGVAEWINPSTVGLPPAAPEPRALAHGVWMVQDEEVSTDVLGAADFTFLNRSRLLVGPRCAVTLTSAYYDPELDTDVREFNLETLTQCLTKADTIVAGDRIVIKTSVGDVNIDGAAAIFAMQSDDSSQRGRAPDEFQNALAMVYSGAIPLGGRIEFGGEVLLRSDYVIAILADGSVLGPVQASPQLVQWLQSGLEGVGSQAERGAWTGDYILGEIDGLPDFFSPLLVPPPTCVHDACEFRVRPGTQVIIETGGEDNDTPPIEPDTPPIEPDTPPIEPDTPPIELQ